MNIKLVKIGESSCICPTISLLREFIIPIIWIKIFFASSKERIIFHNGFVDLLF